MWNRRVLPVLLMIAIVLSFSGCGSQSEIGSLSVCDFMSTYKRMSLEDFMEAPTELIEDLPKLIYSKKDESFLEEWEKEDNSYLHLPDTFEDFEYDGIIFNLPTTFHADFAKDELYGFSIVLSLETSKDDFDCAVSLCKYMFDKYGDASEIEIDNEEASEHDLIQLFSEENRTNFESEWPVAEKEDICIRVYYWNASDVTSFVHLSVRGDMLHPFTEEEAVTALLPEQS